MKILNLIFLLGFAICQNTSGYVYNNVPNSCRFSGDLIYDANAGNAALANEQQIYIHGIISENSLTSSDWKHRINPWLTRDQISDQ